MNKAEVEFRVLICVVLAALIASSRGPSDMLTWFLESVPVMIGIPILMIMRHRFPLTPLLIRLLAVHALVLLLGAYYTSAKVPIGFWAEEAFDLSRNHYDRFAHVVQGFVPAILAREILLRKTPLRPGGWLSGDDYDSWNWPGVVQAVADMLDGATPWCTAQWRWVKT